MGSAWWRLAFRRAASSAYSSPPRAQRSRPSSPTTRSRTFHGGWTAPRAPFLKRLVFHFIREYFRRDAERCPGVTFQTVLDNASALYQAERIQVPVLLIHGDQDGAAPVEESRRLAARLATLGRDVELVVIAGGRHVFNFKQPTQAQEAWQVTLQWLARHLAVDRNDRQTLAIGASQDRSPLRHSCRVF